uniref:GDP-D-glucose phosphorylase 1 n=1 Tax=Ciona savignyi TaxID=51511 RepID=H2Z0S6_CIOSA
MVDFYYNDVDVNRIFVENTNEEINSSFDDLVKSSWHKAQANGVCKYKLEIQCRKIPGSISLLVQLNTQRTTKRRVPLKFTEVDSTFDPDQFNFTKIKDNEVLFDIYKGDKDGLLGSAIINASPFAIGHILLVPDVHLCRPQMLTERAIQLALDTQALSTDHTLVTVFNSLCGQASVNHLHLHCYYMPQTQDEIQPSFLLQQQFSKLLEISNKCYICNDLPVPAFLFTVSSANDITVLSRKISKITDFFVSQGIAHNFAAVKYRAPTGGSTVRVFLWVRKKLSDVHFNIKIGFGACELAGHVFAGSELYENLSEHDMNKVYKESLLPCDQFQLIVEQVNSILASN